MSPRVTPRRVITIDDSGAVTRPPVPAIPARRPAPPPQPALKGRGSPAAGRGAAGVTPPLSPTPLARKAAPVPQTGSLVSRSSSISLSEAVRAVQFPDSNSPRMRAYFLMGQQERETLTAVRSASGSDDFLFAKSESEENDFRFNNRSMDIRSRYWVNERATGRNSIRLQSVSAQARQDTLLISGQGIDACALYGSNVPSLVYACRMGLVPEPEYRVIFFSGLAETLDPNDMGPEPVVQAPIWAYWATSLAFTYQYPGTRNEEGSEARNEIAIQGKQGQAYDADSSNQDLSSNDYLIVVGYSAGADAALMFASRYTGNAFISDVVLLGPTMTGGLDPFGLTPNTGAVNIAQNNEWQRMIEGLTINGTDVFVFDDRDSAIQPDYSGLMPTGAGRFDYIGPLSAPNANRATISANPNRSGVMAEEVWHIGTAQFSPLPTNLNDDLLEDVIYWVNRY